MLRNVQNVFIHSHIDEPTAQNSSHTFCKVLNMAVFKNSIREKKKKKKSQPKKHYLMKIYF